MPQPWRRGRQGRTAARPRRIQIERDLDLSVGEEPAGDEAGNQDASARAQRCRCQGRDDVPWYVACTEAGCPDRETGGVNSEQKSRDHSDAEGSSYPPMLMEN